MLLCYWHINEVLQKLFSVHIFVTEVLPLVEFFVEEDIDDKEAVSLLELEPVKKDKDKFKETKSTSKKLYFFQCHSPFQDHWTEMMHSK